MIDFLQQQKQPFRRGPPRIRRAHHSRHAAIEGFSAYIHSFQKNSGFITPLPLSAPVIAFNKLYMEFLPFFLFLYIFRLHENSTEFCNPRRTHDVNHVRVSVDVIKLTIFVHRCSSIYDSTLPHFFWSLCR